MRALLQYKLSSPDLPPSFVCSRACFLPSVLRSYIMCSLTVSSLSCFRPEPRPRSSVKKTKSRCFSAHERHARGLFFRLLDGKPQRSEETAKKKEEEEQPSSATIAVHTAVLLFSAMRMQRMRNRVPSHLPASSRRFAIHLTGANTKAVPASRDMLSLCGFAHAIIVGFAGLLFASFRLCPASFRSSFRSLPSGRRAGDRTSACRDLERTPSRPRAPTTALEDTRGSARPPSAARCFTQSSFPAFFCLLRTSLRVTFGRPPIKRQDIGHTFRQVKDKYTQRNRIPYPL